jgi:hypothetical protein
MANWSKRRKWQSETANSVCEEVGISDPVEGVIQLAENLTRQCSLVHTYQNLPMIASYQGAKIEELDMDDAGRIIPIFEEDEDFDYLIQVNASHPPARRNFSICHEIGHTLMPNFLGASEPRYDREVMAWNEEAEEEFLCDVAATELLMPRREFVPRLRGCGMRIESVAELAIEFGSSLEATALNIVRANIDDVAVIIWEKGWNKKQLQAVVNPSIFGEEEGFGPVPRSFRIKSVASCGLLSDYHFPRNKSIEEESLIYQAAATGLAVCGHQILPIGGDDSNSFFTQSMAFPISRDGELEQRVFTMVHLKQPVWEW